MGTSLSLVSSAGSSKIAMPIKQILRKCDKKTSLTFLGVGLDTPSKLIPRQDSYIGDRKAKLVRTLKL